MGQAGAMSLSAALILAMDAAAGCGATAPAPLGGRAEVVRAILVLEPLEHEPAAPVLAAFGFQDAAAPADATPGTDEPDADPAPAQCKAAAIVIA